MDDVLRQRIKYLVEHGELYPTIEDNRREYRKIWIAISALAVFQIADTLVQFLR